MRRPVLLPAATSWGGALYEEVAEATGQAPRGALLRAHLRPRHRTPGLPRAGTVRNVV